MKKSIMAICLFTLSASSVLAAGSPADDGVCLSVPSNSTVGASLRQGWPSPSEQIYVAPGEQKCGHFDNGDAVQILSGGKSGAQTNVGALFTRSNVILEGQPPADAYAGPYYLSTGTCHIKSAPKINPPEQRSISYPSSNIVIMVSNHK